MVRENYSIKRIYSLTAGSTNIEFKFELNGKKIHNLTLGHILTALQNFCLFVCF